MADSMTIADAAAIVRPLARERVREGIAFAKLDDALALATTLESALARLTKSRNELAAEVLTLTATKTGLESALTDLNTLHATTTAELAKKAQAHAEDLDRWITTETDSLASLRATIAAEAEAGEKAKRALVADREALLDRIESTHRARLAEIRRQTDEAQGTFKATQERFATLLDDAKKTAGVM